MTNKQTTKQKFQLWKCSSTDYQWQHRKYSPSDGLLTQMMKPGVSCI